MSRSTTHHVPERFLRQIWKHQRFSTDNLQTADGRSIEILSPGKLNCDGGPDFLDASLRIGNILYRGNIEIHRRDKDWNDHRHDHDPKYNPVILHVVLRADLSDNLPTTRSRRTVPTLALDQYLQLPFHSIWDTMIGDERNERMETIRCHPYNDRVDILLLKRWLEKLAVERFELKMQRFDERLKELVTHRQILVNEVPPRYDEAPFGIHPEELPPPALQYSLQDVRSSQLWNQLLYEGICEGVGYSKNQTPFLKLGRNVTLATLREILKTDNSPLIVFQIEALLFGVAGLLPVQRTLKEADSKKYVSSLVKTWKTFRTAYHSECLDSSEWQFFRLRPENFPTVRLAGTARLISSLLQNEMFRSTIRLCKNNDLSPQEKRKRLQLLFVVPADGFWKNHYRFGEISRHPVKTLVGIDRSADIVINVVLPVCLLYGRVFKDKEIRQNTLAVLAEFPPSHDNAVTRTIGDQLIKNRFVIDSVTAQQGMLQLYKMYCVNNRCAECAVGEKVLP